MHNFERLGLAGRQAAQAPVKAMGQTDDSAELRAGAAVYKTFTVSL
jgi:hypothetical protein